MNTRYVSGSIGVILRSVSRKLTVCAVIAFLAKISPADQIIMKDGDRVTGEIVKLDAGMVTIKSRDFGTLTLKWADIGTLTTDKPLNVVLSDNRNARGNLVMQDGRVQISPPGQALNPSDVIALRDDVEEKAYERLHHPGIFDLWTVSGSLNLAGAKGNAETSTLITPINFARTSNTSRITAYFDSIRSTATINGVNGQTAKDIRGGWAYDRNFTKKMFFNAFNDYEYDKFQLLNLRVVLGGGVGYHLWSGDSGQLSVVVGADWNREAFGASPTLGAFTRSSAEAFWGDGFNYKVSSRTVLNETFRMFNNLSDTGQYRINFDVGATTQLVKWLNWTIAVSDRYLSDPVPGRKSSDFIYSTGLGFSFAR